MKYKNKRAWIESVSQGRKKFLRENPDLHPWKKNRKFKSIPCEQLKDFLRSRKINFVEEVTISNSKNYAVDILFPDKNLIFEVNGNQHYNKDGTLKEYYQKRHDHICSLGWKVVEIHYSLAYDHVYCLSLISSTDQSSTVLPFEKREKKIRTSKRRGQKVRERNIELASTVIQQLKQSSINFQKFGWVKQAAEILKVSPQKVNCWMKRNAPDFYQNCYVRKVSKC